MDSSYFVNAENVNLLWEVINDDVSVKNKLSTISMNYESFNTNMVFFYEKEKNNKRSLVELNKRFVSKMVYDISQINTHKYEEPSQPLITKQDIRMNRITEFDKEYLQKQNNFNELITKPVPPTPIFKDKMDGPINEMDELIKQTIAQRNYEVNQYTSLHETKNPQHFLKPQETSVKNDNVKYISIDNTTTLNVGHNIIDLSPSISSSSIEPTIKKTSSQSQYKNVSWGDLKQDSFDIFSKLKNIEPEPEPEKKELDKDNVPDKKKEDEKNTYTLIGLKEEIKLAHAKLNELVELLKMIDSKLT
jgi:hypothetical protein